MIHKSPRLAKNMEEKEDFWGEVETSQNEAIPSVMISGEPQTMPTNQQMYGAQQQMILLQQPSSAPKVIGIFVIIWGALNAVGGLSLIHNKHVGHDLSSVPTQDVDLLEEDR